MKTLTISRQATVDGQTGEMSYGRNAQKRGVFCVAMHVHGKELGRTAPLNLCGAGGCKSTSPIFYKSKEGNIMKSSTKDQMQGTVAEATGAVKQKAGEVLGNRKLEMDGMKQKLEGKVQKTVGKIEKAVGK
jgi:uncharacterized protein YjbJ (UPF0337 family)